MLHKVAAYSLIFTFVGTSVASAGTSTRTATVSSRMAPADEYFGHLKESVLEIRNRLDELDRRSNGEMLEPGTLEYLDGIQDAIHDWERKYPGDPWLPRAIERLTRDYQRAAGS